MSRISVLIVLASGVASCMLTYFVWKVALARGLLDVPNERSSHTRATPRGGGLSIVLVTSAGAIVLALLQTISAALALALVGGGALVAFVGYCDDRKAVHPGVRLAVHFLAAGLAVACIGGIPELRFGGHVSQLGWGGYLLALLVIVWTLNLFNFMDGIDGIAATEAIFITVAAACLQYSAGTSTGLNVAALLLGAACAGFLVWNWPPAKIFLGDVGSGYIGYVIAVLAISACRRNPVNAWIWLILGSLFFVDATLTLARRFARREAPHAPHRSHAYQWLARRWQSHGKVTAAVAALDLAWLLPIAAIAAARPDWAAWLTVVALGPLALAVLVAGAGRRE